MANRATHVRDAKNRTVQSVYDDAGRLTKTIFPDGTYTQSLYDKLGRAYASRDQRDMWKAMDYDTLGRLASVRHPVAIDSNGQVVNRSDTLTTTYGYDELGHKVTQTDARGRVTRFAYDNRGRVISRTLPPVSGQPNRSEYMAYNVLGQMTAKTDFRGYTTQFFYDTRGRMTEKRPDSRLNEDSVFFYYPDEFTKRALRGSIETVYKYDEQQGFLKEVQAPYGTLKYSYDSVGNKTSMQVLRSAGAGGAIVSTTTYSYDDLNRLDEVTLPGNQVVDYEYDEVGNKKSVTRPNGTVTSYAYDSLNRLTDMVSKRGTTELSRFHYIVRDDGKRSGVQETISHDANGTRQPTYREVAYSYDDHGWLTGEAGQDGNGDAYNKTYTHDDVGNRVSVVATKNGVADYQSAHTYNGRDELTQLTTTQGGVTSTVAYDYNLNGAQISVTSNPGTAQEHTTANIWDFEGHLLSTGTQGATSGHTAYRYDANGMRLSTTTKVGVVGQEKTTTYLLDETQPFAQVVEERDAAGELQNRYFHGLEMGPIRQDYKHEQGVGGYITRFALPDGLDSTRQLSEIDGVVTDSYFYDAFGAGLAGDSGNSPNSYRFNGQQLDGASGMYYLRARYYNQGLGRFISHDPLLGNSDDPVSLHRYLYASADPIGLIDPSGQESVASVTNTLTTQMLMAGQHVQRAFTIYDRVNTVYDALNTANSIYQVFNSPGSSSYGALKDAFQGWMGGSFKDYLGNAVTFTSEDAWEKFQDNFLDALMIGLPQWGVGLAGSVNSGKKVQGILLYMPNPVGLPTSPLTVPTAIKIDGIPIKLVFGQKKHIGRVMGIGIQIGNQQRQLFRMDAGPLNPKHGGGGAKAGELVAPWDDGNFHFHVMRY